MLIAVKPYNSSPNYSLVQKPVKKTGNNAGIQEGVNNPSLSPVFCAGFILDTVMPEMPEKKPPPLLIKNIKPTCINNHLGKINTAKHSVKFREDWRDFILWRNNLCRLKENFAGGVTLEDKEKNQKKSFNLTSYKFEVDGIVYQDYLLRSMDDKLRGYMSLSKKKAGDKPVIYINRLISFCDEHIGIGESLIQTAVETSLLADCGGRVELNAKSFTEWDNSPVGFYYKEGFKSKDKDKNREIEEELSNFGECYIDGVEMFLPDEGINTWKAKIKENPILKDTQTILENK